MDIQQHIQTTINQLCEGIHEREQIIAVCLLGTIAGHNTFLYGPPGTAKSLISRRLANAFENPQYFEYLMNRFSTPEEIFGPVSIKALKQDQYLRKTEHYLPKLEFGKFNTVIAGKIAGKNFDSHNEQYLPLMVSNPLYYDNYKIEIAKDNSFSLKLPLYTSNTFGLIQSQMFRGKVIFTSTAPTTLNLRLDSLGKSYDNIMTNSLGLTCDDFNRMDTITYNILMDSPQIDGFKTNEMTLDQFFNYSCQYIETQIGKVKSRNLPKKIEELLSIDLKIWYLSSIFLSYENYRYRFCEDTQKETFEEFKKRIAKPNTSYYQKVFEYIDLNNSYYCYSPNFCMMMKDLLKNKEINIPSIGDTQPTVWLSQVKEILGNSVDDKSLFGQLLVAQSYIIQLEESSNFLSEKQKTNIQDFYKGALWQNLVLEKNKTMIALKSEQSIKETPKVDKSKIIETIVSMHKGKTVLIDFWATWCGPCVNAISELEPLKKELMEKGVDFVYITNVTSPIGLWRSKIKDIMGDHYYLKDEEWKQILDDFGFKVIPSYLIYDKNGVLKHKFTSHPGIKEMVNRINDAL